jgi:hypothetical protein
MIERMIIGSVLSDSLKTNFKTDAFGGDSTVDEQREKGEIRAEVMAWLRRGGRGERAGGSGLACRYY